MPAPLSPPLIESSRVVIFSEPFGFVSPWHDKQYFSKMGLISLTKSTLSAANAVENAAAVAAITYKRFIFPLLDELTGYFVENLNEVTLWNFFPGSSTTE